MEGQLMKCEICKNTAHHRHHIISKSKGGNNKKNNLVHLCASCHVEVHKGNLVIEGWFMTTNGLQLIWHKKEETSITGVSPDVYLI